MTKEQIKNMYLKMAKNFMTPTVKRWELNTNNKIIELSEGIAINGDDIYGVSEFEVIEEKLQPTKRGELYTNLKDAQKYYNSLNN